MANDLPQYTLQDISTHNTRESAWVLIGGIIYDVTKYLDEHPGGLDILLEHAGQEATKDFEEIGHSREARNKMKEFIVGRIDESSPVKNSPSSNSSDRNKCHCVIM